MTKCFPLVVLGLPREGVKSLPTATVAVCILACLPTHRQQGEPQACQCLMVELWVSQLES